MLGNNLFRKYINTWLSELFLLDQRREKLPRGRLSSVDRCLYLQEFDQIGKTVLHCLFKLKHMVFQFRVCQTISYVMLFK